MNCPNCGTEMELEEYYTDFLDNDTKMCLREYFWCASCNTTAIKFTNYKKVNEEFKVEVHNLGMS